MMRTTSQTTLPVGQLVPVKRTRVYSQVVEQVNEFLGSGVVAPGDRLPSERELAARFQVSRASLRQALTAIEVSGYIEVRAGSGAYVVAIPEPPTDGSSTASEAVTISAAPLEILEARLLIEPSVARLAASRRSESDIEVMRSLIDRMAAEIDEGRDGWEADWGFHGALGAATQNASLEGLAAGFRQQMEQPVWSLMRSRNLERVGRARGYIRDHERILRAIRSGDGGLAEEVMAQHIDHVIADLDAEDMVEDGDLGPDDDSQASPDSRKKGKE